MKGIIRISTLAAILMIMSGSLFKGSTTAREFFPNDIMQDNNSMNIENFEIGEYTRYLIGWSPEIDAKFMPLLTDKIIFF